MKTQQLLHLMKERLSKKQEILKQKREAGIDYDQMEEICQLKGSMKELEHWIDLIKIQESIDKADESEDNK